jgi:hypothetical protein
MPSHFCLSIRFLDMAFHGRRDGNQPEWPPSPLRLQEEGDLRILLHCDGWKDNPPRS